ncbi:hypothetical protein L0152_13085, partial [bacterium]|nr:hypothetical protein [bacterium]
YGKLVRMYEENIREMQIPTQAWIQLQVPGPTENIKSTPDGNYDDSAELRKKLENNLDKIKKDLADTKPLYEEVLKKETFDTEMLRRYLSNYPDSPRTSEVKYRLAENYRILKKHSDAVGLYLEVLNDKNVGEWAQLSHDSLLQMIPSLDDLSACFKIAEKTKDSDLKLASNTRMKSLSGTFTKLENGYEFRRQYPTSEFEKPVRDQLIKLASETLHQAKLYQAVGEYQKALDHYNQILRYCSDLPVADQVKETMIDFQELQSSIKKQTPSS